MTIKKVGVAGCGLMGSGIAQASAQSGYEVIVSEINEDLLNKGLASINKVLSGRVGKGKISEQDKNAVLGRIDGTTDLDRFSQCDLVIEAITENMDMKRSLFTELDKVCPPHTILATNTSILSVIKIAAATKRLDKVLGMHFFYPAPVMKLLEVVRTIATSDETLKASRKFGESIGKTTIVAKDTPGFIVNRLHLPYVLNAIRMLETGVATREDIDNGVKLGLNFPMGPLTLSDMLGVDTLYFIACSIYEETKDLQFAPPSLLGKMVDAGWHGCKAGRGFYEYNTPA
jgi:3-hydroxybutyryl-CoA dehydrogenase